MSGEGVIAKKFFEFKVYGADDRHIVTLRLQRQPGMTDGDMMQMQNYLWTQVGLAIRENKEMHKMLQHGGIEVLLDDPTPDSAAAN